MSYDVVIPSDYMISRLISEGMLEKLDFSKIPNLSLIDENLRFMEYDPDGRIQRAVYLGNHRDNI